MAKDSSNSSIRKSNNLRLFRLSTRSSKTKISLPLPVRQPNRTLSKLRSRGSDREIRSGEMNRMPSRPVRWLFRSRKISRQPKKDVHCLAHTPHLRPQATPEGPPRRSTSLMSSSQKAAKRRRRRNPLSLMRNLKIRS